LLNVGRAQLEVEKSVDSDRMSGFGVFDESPADLKEKVAYIHTHI
jgi:hypothetical protein